MNNPKKKKIKKANCNYTQKIKCLGISLTNEVKNEYTENYKVLLEEIQNDPNKWK